MISVIIQGGLGNQMFQTAFGVSMGKKYNEKVRFITTREKYKVTRYFEAKNFKIDCDGFSGYKISVMRKLFPNQYLKYINVTRLNDFASFETNEKLLKNKGTYEGTFNSIQFFEAIQKDIKELFTLKEEYVQEYLEKFSGLKDKKTIIIHIRRTDYKTFGNKNFGGDDLSLPIDYYKKALSMVKNIEDYQIIAIGDNIDGIAEEFAGYDIQTFVNNEIVDFQLLMNGSIVIAANSTFSWWAAYLNDKAEAVFIPKFWLGFHLKKVMPESILEARPENWKLVDF